MLNPSVIKQAYTRISEHIHHTPIFTSSLLNEWLGHDIYFKMDNMQKTGSFKVRGALNGVLSYLEKCGKPSSMVAFSSGNHAAAMAYIGQMLGIPTKLFLTSFTSQVKVSAIRNYGAEINFSDTRQEAEQKTYDAAAEGALLVKPYGQDDVLAGAGTAAYEALSHEKYDAIFATCGGGGWLSGTYLAKELLSPDTKVFGVEPARADDAFRSLNDNKIFQFEQTPDTIADGAKTLHIAPTTFKYLKQLDGFYLAKEKRIYYWTQWLSHLLKSVIEPTSALTMAGVEQWIEGKSERQKILVLLSGGNVDFSTISSIWKEDMLQNVPHNS